MFFALLSLSLAADGALPPPGESRVRFSQVVDWPAGKQPVAAAGFKVSKFAEGLDSPRWIYVLPNGDVLVAESKTPPKKSEDKEKQEGMAKSRSAGPSANRITLFRGQERMVFAANLHQPFGMALVGDTFYIGNTDRVVAYPYKTGQTKLEGIGKTILDLPAGGYNNHWTRNLLPSADGSKLYVSVGSGSNVAEHGMKNEERRANILEVNLDGSGSRVFASGLRNPVGMAWEPKTGALWTAVNERDELGDELVPDYITSVKDGGFYGWPYSYFGANEDPRRKGERPDLVAKAIVPDFALGSHTASLGLAFGKLSDRNGAFIGQHGSWNRSEFSGYRVAFVPFTDGKPSGPAEDFLTGFIASASEVYGRPVGVAFTADGALLVADDAGNCIWRVTAEGR